MWFVVKIMFGRETPKTETQRDRNKQDYGKTQ